MYIKKFTYLSCTLFINIRRGVITEEMAVPTYVTTFFNNDHCSGINQKIDNEKLSIFTLHIIFWILNGIQKNY